MWQCGNVAMIHKKGGLRLLKYEHKKQHKTISNMTTLYLIRESVPLRWSAPRQLERQLHHSLPTYSKPKVVDKHEACHGGYGYGGHDNHDGQSSIGLCLVILVIVQVLLHPLPIHMKAKMVTFFWDSGTPCW